jgi:hypothetical protein
MECLTVHGRTVWRNDYLADLSRLHCSGVFADVRLNAGRGEDSKQTPILTNSLLLAAMDGAVVSMMEEGNKGEDGFWDIIIPDAMSLELQATFLDLMKGTPRKESIIVLEDLFLLKNRFVSQEEFYVVKEEFF